MSWVDVEDILAGWFQLVINPAVPVTDPPTPQPMPIILLWSGEKGVRPTTDYIMFNIISIKPIGMANKSAVKISTEFPDGLQYKTMTKQFTLSITAFGRSAMDLLQALQDSIDSNTISDQISEYFYNNNLAISDYTPIIDISFTEIDGIEIKKTFDVMFFVTISTGMATGYIETVEMTGTVINVDGTEKNLEL
jgi:hypothetical protein